VNCCVVPAATLAAPGKIVTVLETVTIALAVTEESAALVATIV
jgi:hypothetical protein